MNYSEMSDFEINCAVGKAISFADSMLARNGQVDYCNSWADAGPIIHGSGINLMASKVVDREGMKEWEAMSYEGNCHHWGELNPLRAAMIVFLMMKEADNAN